MSNWIPTFKAGDRIRVLDCGHKHSGRKGTVIMDISEFFAQQSRVHFDDDLDNVLHDIDNAFLEERKP